MTLRVRRSFAPGQRLQTSRCYSWESLGEKEKAVAISSFSKNLQFCRFFFETESEAPGPLFSLECLPRSVITGDIHSTHEILHFLLSHSSYSKYYASQCMDTTHWGNEEIYFEGKCVTYNPTLPRIAYLHIYKLVYIADLGYKVRKEIVT